VEWKEKEDIFAGITWCRCHEVASWEALNLHLREESRRDEERRIGERKQTVGAGMTLEREHLRALAEEGFDLASVHFPQVNGSGCVRVLTNFYSAPVPVGSGSASQGALGVRGDLAPRTLRGEARPLFRPTAEDPEPGALPGCADEEARSFGGLDPVGAMAGPRDAGRRASIVFGRC
jgi:hypothetical protein